MWFCLSPLVALYLACRVALGRDKRDHIRNRRGIATATRNSPVIWLHAASVGELKSVRALLKYFTDRFPAHQLLVTTNNPTALRLASGWHDLALTLQAAPLDSSRSICRFLDHWQPVAFVNVEGEFWPNRLTSLAKRNIPAVFVNTRLSDRSSHLWLKSGLGSLMLADVKAFFCQNQATAAKIAAFGVPAGRIECTRNLKSLVDASFPKAELDDLKNVFQRDRTILAASTHRDEEARVIEAFAACRETDNTLKLILAPRHPDRGPEVEKLIVNAGLQMAVRSRDRPTLETQVYLVDSLGDMPLFYALAGITFVGGSLVPKGGHTPYEPIRFDSAIVTGPQVSNFQDEYSKLGAAKGCATVHSVETLTRAFAALLDDATRDAQVQNARIALPVCEDADDLFARMVQPLGLKETPHEPD